MSVRKAVVAGQFYPGNADEIEKMVTFFNEVLEEGVADSSVLQTATRAVIVPHAGYVYSGFTANAAYRLLANAKPERIVVIGPSHRHYFQGSSVALYDEFETPLGPLSMDRAFAKELMERFDLNFVPRAHAEHSTEVQMPFLARYLPDSRVVELVYAEESPHKLARVIEWVLQQKNGGVVISTDLSHYHDLQEAKRLDGVCLEAVRKLDAAMLEKGCEACGKIGMAAMLEAAGRLGLKALPIDYRTSADASGDTERVVGYMSAAFV